MRTKTEELSGLYTTDFYRWAVETAAALRRNEVEDLDLENIAEELEGLARSERRELRNRLKPLMAHLLKWRYQPQKRSVSWRATVNEQREEIAELLADNPSLNRELESLVVTAYPASVNAAVLQTSLPYETFPNECPFTLDEIRSKDLNDL